MAPPVMSFHENPGRHFLKSRLTVTKYQNKSSPGYLSSVIYPNMSYVIPEPKLKLTLVSLGLNAVGTIPLEASPPCSRVRGRGRGGQGGPAASRGEGDGRGLLSGFQLVAGRAPAHPDPEGPALGEAAWAGSSWIVRSLHKMSISHLFSISR